MRKEVLQATIAEIAKTACCAWEDYAKRNRGVDGPGLYADKALREWRSVEVLVRDNQLIWARAGLATLRAWERLAQQAWHAELAGDVIGEYEREAGPC